MQVILAFASGQGDLIGREGCGGVVQRIRCKIMV